MIIERRGLKKYVCVYAARCMRMYSIYKCPTCISIYNIYSSNEAALAWQSDANASARERDRDSETFLCTCAHFYRVFFKVVYYRALYIYISLDRCISTNERTEQASLLWFSRKRGFWDATLLLETGESRMEVVGCLRGCNNGRCWD